MSTFEVDNLLCDSIESENTIVIGQTSNVVIGNSGGTVVISQNALQVQDSLDLQGVLDLQEQTTVSAPPSGTGRLFARSTGLFFTNGVEINLTAWTGQNLGAGTGLFSATVGEILQFKSLASTNLQITSDATTVTITSDESSLDHDSLGGFNSSEHIDHTGVQITGTDGISGGGDITADRQLALDIDGLPTALINTTADFIPFSSGSGNRKFIPDVLFQQAYYLDVYDSIGGQTFTGGIIIDLDTVRTNSGEFSVASGVVTCNVDAVLELTMRASTDISSGAARSTSIAYIERDIGLGTFSIVPGSIGHMYNRLTPQGNNTATVSVILDVSSGDRFRIAVQRESGSDTLVTLPNSSSLTIKSIGAQGIQGAQGIAGSGSSINIQSEGTTLVGGPYPLLNFTGTGLTVNDIGGVATIDVMGGTGNIRHYGPSATDPTSPLPTAGDEYYNTVINEKMVFDGSRGKWLSVTSLFDGCGFNGNMGANTFYRRFNGLTLTATTGALVQKGTICRIGYTTNGAVNHTLEVLVDGIVVASLSSGGSARASGTFNADFLEGNMSFRNAGGSGTTSNLQCTVYYKLRA